MRVLKFGGSILRQASDVQAMAEILRQTSATPTLVIVSALGSSTRDLDQCCRVSLEHPERAAQLCDELMRRTQQWSEILLQTVVSKQAFALLVDDYRTQILQFLRGIGITRQCTARVRDKVLSFGEHIAAALLGLYMRDTGLDVQSVNAEDVIVTNDNYGAAEPLRRESHHNVARVLLPLFASHNLVMMPGFVARSEHGETTTMGRESSNLSAALMAQLLHADELIVYTDVEGIRTADPGLVPNSQLVPSLSYAQAYTLAASGVKLLYPTMIEPLRSAHIPMRICSLHSPEGPSTRIGTDTIATSLKVALVLNGLSLLHVQARSLKAATQLPGVLDSLLQFTDVQNISLTRSALSIVASPERCADIALHIPDDCSFTRHDGLDLVRLVHSPNIALHDLVAAVKRAVPNDTVLRCTWSDAEHCSHIVCRSELSAELCQQLHDALLRAE